MIQISQTAVYALQVIIELSRLRSDHAVRAKDIRGKTGVPLPFLSKILRRLVEKKLLLAQKGPHGGFLMALPPEKIHLSDIFHAAGYNIEKERCLLGLKKCGSANPCAIHHSWSFVKETFISWAENVTVADVIGLRKNK
ncbi:MAG: Rrf2 family transcriptional regulator [Deltaproteobacteria bacterium]|nr:Rrf2 family transcriptional regulator [Deltaproteobacteria bacterium]MBI2501598.1 Rrf2 family transcriptional regulator [Deltaproteobacteria bacterium]